MNKNTIIFLLLLALGYFVYRNGFLKSDNIQLKKKLSDSERSKIELMKKYIKDCKDVPKEMARQLEELKVLLSKSRPDIADELGVVAELLAAGHNEIAVEKLTKCLENILKNKVIEEGLEKSKQGFPPLQKLLEIAKNQKWLSAHHYNFFLFIKEMRNQEAHEVGYELGKNEVYIAFFSAIEIMSSLTAQGS